MKRFVSRVHDITAMAIVTQRTTYYYVEEAEIPGTRWGRDEKAFH
jgi:hypothetical protein